MTTKLIADLTHVPNIIAGLGLGIAEAQHHFDLTYLQALERLMVMAQSMLGGKKATADGKSEELTDADRQRLQQFETFIKEFLVALAPPRYQFTETTLDVKLDLAQSLDAAGESGLSAGIGAVAVNASLSVGYSYDYRAAAECRTVLHAVPTEPATLRMLLDRAREISQKDLSLPERTAVDQAVQLQAEKIFEKLVGVKPAPVTAENK